MGRPRPNKRTKAYKRQVQNGTTPDILTRMCPGTSARKTARAVGVTLPHLSRVLSGKRKPSLELASRLASHLGVTLDRLYVELAVVQDERSGR